MGEPRDDEARAELLAKLRRLRDMGDPEDAHIEADRALLAYIDDDEIRDAFAEIDKWYA